MKKIYLMRHGETLFNTMDVNQGQCDSPLTENGIRQAKAAKAWFDAHNVHFDAVYSSTSERACDTAELVSGGMSYTRRKDLKEISLGIKEASPIRENPTYPYGDYFVKYGGEDLDAFTERVYGAVKDIAEHTAGEYILIVSHGMAIRRFLTKFPEKAGRDHRLYRQLRHPRDDLCRRKADGRKNHQSQRLRINNKKSPPEGRPDLGHRRHQNRMFPSKRKRLTIRMLLTTAATSRMTPQNAKSGYLKGVADK